MATKNWKTPRVHFLRYSHWTMAKITDFNCVDESVTEFLSTHLATTSRWAVQDVGTRFRRLFLKTSRALPNTILPFAVRAIAAAGRSAATAQHTQKTVSLAHSLNEGKPVGGPPRSLPIIGMLLLVPAGVRVRARTCTFHMPLQRRSLWCNCGPLHCRGDHDKPSTRAGTGVPRMLLFATRLK